MAKELTQRQLRVGQEIKRIIAGLIERDEIRNLMGLGALVTVTEARISPDLKYCNVYIITSHKEKDKIAQEALQLAANYIKKTIGKNTNLRSVPELVFRIDDTFEQVDKIEQLLHHPKVRQDLENDN